MNYELAKRTNTVYNAGMPKIYNRTCNTCSKGYVGSGKYYCSPKCQPRDYYNGSDKIAAEKHYKWKGDNAGYHAIHIWIEKYWVKQNKCENPDCVYPRKNAARSWVMKPKRFEWALKKGRTYSRDRQDYMELCKSCHAKYDYGLSTGSLA